MNSVHTPQFRGAFSVCFGFFRRGVDGMISTKVTFVSFKLLAVNSGINKSIYAKKENNLTNAGNDIIGMIGSIGSICFTIAVMVIAIAIIFGSISPKNIGKWWMAFFSCCGGAALFFGAYLFADVVANLFSGK